MKQNIGTNTTEDGEGASPKGQTDGTIEPSKDDTTNCKKISSSEQDGMKNKKSGPTSERDSVNALLSLGRDLAAGESEGQGDGDGDGASETSNAASKRIPEPIFPSNLATKITRKRKKTSSKIEGELPDFWYWVPPGDAIGDWDVLCGRGGESNNFVGNRRYRLMVNEQKPMYRAIPLQHRREKTAFVKKLVEHINNCGGRFVDQDPATNRYYVVTMEKARKKTSQALRETKELKWWELTGSKDPKDSGACKDSICPHCNQRGHKTKIAKACLMHHEWLDANTKGASVSCSSDVPTAQPTVQKDEIESNEKSITGPPQH